MRRQASQHEMSKSGPLEGKDDGRVGIRLGLRVEGLGFEDLDRSNPPTFLEHALDEEIASELATGLVFL